MEEKEKRINLDKIDMVNHPPHYTQHPSGVECIEITRHYCFSIGNAIKYLWRAGLKKDASLEDKQKEIEDLEKAIFYIKDRIKQINDSVL
jgi:translation initiation factor 2B subunit (eIF-2B alpha/beta/delta family)